MEPSKEAIAVRITRLNRQILGKATGGNNKLKKTIDRESLLDALTVLYEECNDDPVKKCDELVRAFVDKYRSTLAELRRTRVCLSDFDIVQTIGRGYFGEVHMVREKQTCDVYAMKVMRKETARRTDDERDVLATSTSPWMPRLQYAFQDASSLYLVMELCCGGDLSGLLSRRNHPLSERDAAFYVAEVAHALKALHGMGYVHRDVKPGNILLDRCGHVKLGDFGSCARLSERGGEIAGVGTWDYVSPELLAAAHCHTRHAVCARACQGISVNNAISACDYWSLGVVAFELVTMRRPFSSGDEDSIANILGNIQRYEREGTSEPPFEPSPNGPSDTWRSLVSGLLTVQPDKRYNYLDTLQHPALSHLASHSIRDQAPPWVPCTRGAEDGGCFTPAPRAPRASPAAPFRARPPFAGQLPFVGYSYVAHDNNEDSSGGFNASHDCTAIDLATFKSAEKLAAMRGREIASLQSKLAAAEAKAEAGAGAERARRGAEAEAERDRARLQAEITALTLQNKRLERQVEVEKEERMALQRTNQQLSSTIVDRNNAEVKAAQAAVAEVQAEKEALKEELRRVENKMAELQAECARAADTAQMQHKHYKDTIAKERALRRQTLSGGEAESREAGARVAQAEANYAKEKRQRELLEKRLETAMAENNTLQKEIEDIRKEYSRTEESLGEKRRFAEASVEQLRETQTQLAHEKARVTALTAQVQELERGVEEAGRREAALEEQCSRTEARFRERLEVAEARATSALQDDTRHREKVNTLEQLVRQLEREVGALEARACANCGGADGEARRAHSDTESVGEREHRETTQAAVLREQLERAEAQLQARADEIAALRQEARSANLARWRKEREYNELSVEAKSSAREVKRLEERLSAAIEARKEAEKKAVVLQKELATLKPQYERASKELDRVKEQLNKLKQEHETAQAEVSRSRNDIRKLKSELQYSEKRRLHAEEQEELSSRERAQLRDELTQLRVQYNDAEQNNKALQEACSLLEDQLTDLEKLADMHEIKNKDLETETSRMRIELESCRQRLVEAERAAAESNMAANSATLQHEQARDQAQHALCQLQLLRERLDNRESRVAELEMRNANLEGERSAADAALASAMRRVRELQEECSALRTRAHEDHSLALQLQASLQEAQEEIDAVREASEAANAWWRTRETKADSTLRQQAKLIDFLQAKVEEAGRKKCSLSNKLFGRSGRRPQASPPLRRANRELREEVERLRAKLSAHALNGANNYPPTPISREKSSKINGKKLPVDSPDGGTQENIVVLVRPDGSRERVRAKCRDGDIVLCRGDKETRGRFVNTEPINVPQNEASRAFTIQLEKGVEAAVVCANVAERAHWVSRLTPATPAGYAPATLAHLATRPVAALHVAPNAVAIGTDDGLYSLRGLVTLEFDCEVSPPRHSDSPAIAGMVAVAGRALAIVSGVLAHAGLLALGSALRRASNLKPNVAVSKVRLPDVTTPHLIKAINSESTDGPCAAAACGRRVFLLRFDAATTEFKILRSFTVDRPTQSILLTQRALYIAGEKPLKVNLPSGPLEAFGMDEPIIAAAAKKHSPPKAILLVRDDPLEILLCYAEVGVFVDDKGRRTRNEDAKWSSAVRDFEFIAPFLYLVGEEKITIIYITDEAYKAPPCTCDTTSLASTASECYMPEKFNFNVNDPVLLGTAPNGIIIRTNDEHGYAISTVEGKTAFKSVGASIESLSTVSDSKRSSTDSAQSVQHYVTMTNAQRRQSDRRQSDRRQSDRRQSDRRQSDRRQSDRHSMERHASDRQPPERRSSEYRSIDRRQSNKEESPQDVSHISQESVEATTGFLADIRKRARQLRKKNRQDRSPEDVIKEILTTEVGLKRTSTGRKSPARISECDSDSESATEENNSESSNTKGTAELCAEMFSRQVRFQSGFKN